MTTAGENGFANPFHSCGEPACNDEHSHDHALDAQGLHVHYGKVCAIEDVSIRCNCGQSVALVGPNGAGKSTLLKTLAGLLPHASGTVSWRGAPLSEHRHELAYLPQREAVDWRFPITVRGLAEMGRYPHLGMWRRFGKRDQAVVDQALEALGLTALEKRPIGELSGGQQQRAFLARALAQEAHVLLLDEPFTGLDTASQESLSALIRQLTDDGRLLIISHHGPLGNAFTHVARLERTLRDFSPVPQSTASA